MVSCGLAQAAGGLQPGDASPQPRQLGSENTQTCRHLVSVEFSHCHAWVPAAERTVFSAGISEGSLRLQSVGTLVLYYSDDDAWGIFTPENELMIINALINVILHRVFKINMSKFTCYKYSPFPRNVLLPFY